MAKPIPAIVFALFFALFSCGNSPSVSISEGVGQSADSLAPINEVPSEFIANDDKMKEAPEVEEVVLPNKSSESRLRNLYHSPSNDNSTATQDYLELQEKPALKSKAGSTDMESVEAIRKEQTNAGQNNTLKNSTLPKEIESISNEDWDKLLQTYVSSLGKVNYGGFKKDKARLEAYLETLRRNAPSDNWSRAEKMAFWINTYNAFTIQLIVDNYPISSIMKLDGGKTWDVKRIKIGDKTYSLNNIEHDILRPQFKDARIHFAVNCAAKSCPPILNRAWTAANLEQNLEKQTRDFINNSQCNKISASDIQVSKIFEWYAADFGDLISFLNKYSKVTVKSNAKIKFLEYDWALNL